MTLNHVSTSKVEIPAFEGNKPRWWVQRCERFFNHYRVEDGQRVNLVAAFLNGVADSWFQGRNSKRMVLVYEEFVAVFCVQFGERTMADVVEDLHKLRQI